MKIYSPSETKATFKITACYIGDGGKSSNMPQDVDGYTVNATHVAGIGKGLEHSFYGGCSCSLFAVPEHHPIVREVFNKQLRELKENPLWVFKHEAFGDNYYVILRADAILSIPDWKFWAITNNCLGAASNFCYDYVWLYTPWTDTTDTEVTNAATVKATDAWHPPMSQQCTRNDSTSDDGQLSANEYNFDIEVRKLSQPKVSLMHQLRDMNYVDDTPVFRDFPTQFTTDSWGFLTQELGSLFANRIHAVIGTPDSYNSYEDYRKKAIPVATQLKQSILDHNETFGQIAVDVCHPFWTTLKSQLSYIFSFCLNDWGMDYHCTTEKGREKMEDWWNCLKIPSVTNQMKKHIKGLLQILYLLLACGGLVTYFWFSHCIRNSC